MKAEGAGAVFPDYRNGASVGRAHSTILRIGIGEL